MAIYYQQICTLSRTYKAEDTVTYIALKDKEYYYLSEDEKDKWYPLSEIDKIIGQGKFSMKKAKKYGSTVDYYSIRQLSKIEIVVMGLDSLPFCEHCPQEDIDAYTTLKEMMNRRNE
jgi:molybdenum cofactor biosynthesis enzyme MoaA